MRKSHADDDRKRKELIEARNQADNMAYAAEKAIKEHGDKVPEQLKIRNRSRRSRISAPRLWVPKMCRDQRGYQGARRGHPEDRRGRLSAG